MQGCNVKAHPQVVRRMVNEGHEVGNHTWNHVYLSKVPREKAESQLQSTNEAIRNACGVVPVVMRPPAAIRMPAWHPGPASASASPRSCGMWTLMTGASPAPPWWPPAP
ncbi:polysaccharide deacetylase family protein [Akkermansia muciniphila]|uniref:polysaccharide deacetylase family protein n=1 Tax=Akkermansia muciniphila TaxID=239935 RepID=UPI0034E0AB65